MTKQLMVPDFTRDSLAESLRVGFAAIIKEADEWRPLAQHILDLMSLIDKENQQMRLLIRQIINSSALMVGEEYMIVVIPREMWMKLLDVEYGEGE